jgi:hypothetical protein
MPEGAHEHDILAVLAVRNEWFGIHDVTVPASPTELREEPRVPLSGSVLVPFGIGMPRYDPLTP